MRSPMEHTFSQLPEADIQRSTFKRPHGYKSTFNAGYLIPFYIDEVLPGDTFSLDCDVLARLSTPIVPIMDNMYLETFFFFVPYRLIWDNWEKFCGERKNPQDSIDYLCPQVTTPDGGWDFGSISDYFGLPPKVQHESVSAFFHRAYNLIWNEWFRDENLQDSVEVPTGDGPDDPSIYKLLRRGKRHDYFTSALPWPQKGDSVRVAVGESAFVYGTGQPITLRGSVNGILGDVSSSNADQILRTTAAGETQTYSFAGDTDNVEPSLYADLTSAIGPSVNMLRQAFQIQRMLEVDARSGTRYREVILAHYGVQAPDYRVQVPEYLGGKSERIFFTPVPQTSDTASDQTTPQGNLAAYAFTNSDNNGFVKSFTEFGLVMGLVNVRADLTYQQGIPRMFSRKTRYDYYWPTLAHLGEQAVLNKEIFATGDPDVDDAVFGYQERYAEYRYYPSKITGAMRSTHPQSLDVWHLAQKFDSTPPLNAEFIEDNPPVERILAVQNEPQFYLDAFFDLKSTRPMPVYSIPGLIDHF